MLFEYAHITTLFKTKLDIKNLDQDVLKQDAVYLQGDTNDLKKENEELNCTVADTNHDVLKLKSVEEETPQNSNNAIVATDIIK